MARPRPPTSWRGRRSDARPTEQTPDTSRALRDRPAARQSGIGRPGQTDGYRKILDGTPESFAKSQQVGGGSFALNADGSMKAGLGMLWFPERKYGDFSLRLQWRDDAPGTGNANSGVFVRCPWVHDHPEESRPEWVIGLQVHGTTDVVSYRDVRIKEL